MATIYVITGPPYIGKSTCGQYFIPEGIKILDPNLFVQSYAELGLKDGYRRFEEQLLGLLSHDEDFAVEVNIVNKAHLQMLQDIKALYPENKIEMIFFTPIICTYAKRGLRLRKIVVATPTLTK